MNNEDSEKLESNMESATETQRQQKPQTSTSSSDKNTEQQASNPTSKTKAKKNTDTKNASRSYDQLTSEKPQKSSSGKGLAGLSLLLSILALAGVGYNWWEFNKSPKVLANKAASGEVDSMSLYSELEDKVASLSSSQQTISDELQQVVASLSENVNEANNVAGTDNQGQTSTDQTPDIAQQTEDSSEATAQNKASSEEDNQLLDSIRQQQQQQHTLKNETELSAQKQEIEKATQQMYALVEGAQKRLELTQIQQFLSTASQRLNYFRDTQGAITAYQQASERLAEFTEPRFTPLSQSLENDLSALKKTEQIDKQSIENQISGMLNQVDSLRFNSSDSLLEKPKENEPNKEVSKTTDSKESNDDNKQKGEPSFSDTLGINFKELGSGIVDDLKSMVTIQKTGELNDRLLSFDQQFFIKENLKIFLNSAKRAVTHNNNSIYNSNLTEVKKILNELFAVNDAKTNEFSSQIDQLLAINLEPELPDISQSSVLLNELMQKLALNSNAKAPQ